MARCTACMYVSMHSSSTAAVVVEAHDVVLCDHGSSKKAQEDFIDRKHVIKTGTIANY